jgi:hypothetical protein
MAFFWVGSRPETAPLGDIVDTDEACFIITDEDLTVRTPGAFVTGDARRKSFRQVSTAAGDGAFAAVNLEKICPGEKVMRGVLNGRNQAFASGGTVLESHCQSVYNWALRLVRRSVL